MSVKRCNNLRERGAAAMELAIATPLVLSLGAMCLNLGNYLQYAMRADAAATAGAKYVMNHAAEAPCESDLMNYLAEAFPELGFAEGMASASLEESIESSAQYTYHVYRNDEPETYTAASCSKEFTVRVVAQRPWPAFGKIMGGSDGTYILASSKTAQLDTTDGSQWELA